MVIVKWAFFLIIALALSVLVLFAYKGHQSRAGSIPGLQQGLLQSCPDKPNCVSSEHGEDAQHSIEALRLSESVSVKELTEAVRSLGGMVVKTDEFYLAATFTSTVFGFVDDLELRHEGGGVWQVRSASRVGHSDLGVNRKRVEALRASLQP